MPRQMASKRLPWAARARRSGRPQNSQGIVKVSRHPDPLPPFTAVTGFTGSGRSTSREQAMQGGTLTLLDYSRRSQRRRRNRRRVALVLALAPLALVAGMAVAYWLRIGV